MTAEKLKELRDKAYNKKSEYLVEGEHEATFLVVEEATNNGKNALIIHFTINGTDYRQMYYDKTIYDKDIVLYAKQIAVDPLPEKLYDKTVKIRVQYNGNFINIYPHGTATATQTTATEPVVTEDLF